MVHPAKPLDLRFLGLHNLAKRLQDLRAVAIGQGRVLANSLGIAYRTAFNHTIGIDGIAGGVPSGETWKPGSDTSTGQSHSRTSRVPHRAGNRDEDKKDI